MYAKALEILAIKLAQAEANLAITQAQLEQAQTELQQREEPQDVSQDVQTDI